MISGHQWDRQHWRIEQGAPSENLSKSEHAHRTPRTEDECAGFWHRLVRRFASAKPAPKQAPSNAGGPGTVASPESYKHRSLWMAGLSLPSNRPRRGSLLRRRFGLRASARHALGRAAHIDPRAVASGHFGIHPAQHHGATVEGDDLTILRTARITRRTDIVLAAPRSFELELLELCTVGEIHHHAAIRSARDFDRLAALAACRRCGARKVTFVVKGAVAPAADDLFGAVARRSGRLRHHRRRGGRFQWWCIGRAAGERERTQCRDNGRDAGNTMRSPRAHENLPKQGRLAAFGQYAPGKPSAGALTAPAAQSLLTAATVRLCFKLAHYGTFGEDYGPDLAFWAACRRLDRSVRPACRPAAALAVLAGSVSGADLWILSARIK